VKGVLAALQGGCAIGLGYLVLRITQVDQSSTMLADATPEVYTY
jgi:hypothetical protein